MSPLTHEQLNQFSGTDTWYRHFTKCLTYTEGVKYMADVGGAHWLIDAIASHQPKARRNASLRDFQLWTLSVKDGKAVLTCQEDAGVPPAITQQIEHTDFPLEEVKLYCERGSIDGINESYVLMLPGER